MLNLAKPDRLTQMFTRRRKAMARDRQGRGPLLSINGRQLLRLGDFPIIGKLDRTTRRRLILQCLMILALVEALLCLSG